MATRRTKKVEEVPESPQEAVLIRFFSELIVDAELNLEQVVKRKGDVPHTTLLDFTVSIPNTCFTAAGLKRLNMLASELDKKSKPVGKTKKS